MSKERIEIIEDRQKQFYEFENNIINQVSDFKTLFDILSNNDELLNSKTVYDTLDVIYTRLIELNRNFVYLSGLVSKELGKMEASLKYYEGENTEDIDTKDNTTD